MDTTVLKCPNCGNNLLFNAETQDFKCSFCGTALSQAEAFKITQTASAPPPPPPPPPFNQTTANQPAANQPELNLFHCKNCGAEMVTDTNTASTFCVYCGSTGIIKNRLEGRFQPELIIPFKKSKEDAIQAYNDYRKGKRFAPDEFGRKENIEKITGVYVPFWLYDGKSFGSFEGEKHVSTSWRNGDYIYTKTDISYIKRSGSVEFEKVPADGSKKFDDDTMDSIEPYDFSECQPFDYSFLSGFLAEKYDVSPDEDKSRVEQRMDQSFQSAIYSTIGSPLVNEKVNKTTIITGLHYALLPVWLLNTKIQNKIYTFAMNGQTGLIVGDIPVDHLKMAKFAAIRAAIISVITFIVIYLVTNFL